MTTLGELRSSRKVRAGSEGGSARDVDLFLAGLLGWTTAMLIARDDRDAPPAIVKALDAALERRGRGEPPQYILGKSEFFGRTFQVDNRVLIPRPETEFLVEAAIRRLPAGARLLDVGTGSGCVAISVALERPDAVVVASDLSGGALAVARRNASLLCSSVRFVAADLLAPFRQRFDVIVSNPPYIGEEEIAGLEVQVRAFEPRLALTPGTDGLAVIRRLFAESGNFLRPGGSLLMEIGFGQADQARKIAESAGWRVESITGDLAGIPRVVVSSRPTD